MSKSQLYLRLSVGFFISSFISGFLAAILSDFYPSLTAFKHLFISKAVLGTTASVMLFVAYCDSRS